MYIKDIFLETYDERFLIDFHRFAMRELVMVVEIDWACLMWSLFVVANRYEFRSQAGENCHHSLMYVHGAQCQVQLRELEGSYNIA